MGTETERYEDRPKERAKGKVIKVTSAWLLVEIVILQSTDCSALGLHSNYIILTECVVIRWGT